MCERRISSRRTRGPLLNAVRRASGRAGVHETHRCTDREKSVDSQGWKPPLWKSLSSIYPCSTRERGFMRLNRLGRSHTPSSSSSSYFSLEHILSLSLYFQHTLPVSRSITRYTTLLQLKPNWLSASSHYCRVTCFLSTSFTQLPYFFCTENPWLKFPCILSLKHKVSTFTGIKFQGCWPRHERPLCGRTTTSTFVDGTAII